MSKEEVEKKAAQAAKLKAREDWVSGLLNGGPCTLQMHLPASDFDCMLLKYHLKLRMPHLTDDRMLLEWEIHKEVKKL